MANEVFSRAGLYVDELNKIRIADPDATRETQELKDDCHKFIERMTEFQSVVDKYIAISDKLAAEVEHEKLKAIGSRNLLKSVVKDRETQQQQLQALVLEKKIELERLRIQLNALKREEAEQNELIEQFSMQS
ncbi:intraflagellar transport protein 20 homolog A [Rhipicephalus sanguineus]|uniref:intraflagellar transport protein 20 homolog A n=1 Tax=Rhipicephalus sanguineus TaxID=34632 RepID=UPI00189316A7|nr:intraflagellar transport protein 20 homolog A [Rhipicephalus sanguineus]